MSSYIRLGNLLCAASLMLSVAAPCGAAFSKEDAGTSAGEFLKLGTDARGVAMGQAMTAAAEDVTALFWNPAGLSQMQKNEVNLTGAALYQDMYYGFTAYGRPVRPIIQLRRRFLRPSGLGTLAVGALYLSAGTLQEKKNDGTKTGGSFTPRDIAIMAGWGGSLTNNFDLGIAFKLIDSKIHSEARTGAVDAGLRFRLHLGDWPYVFALSARNLGGRLQYRSQRDPLPMTFSAGQTLRPFRQWILSADVVLPRDNDIYPALGTELEIPTPGEAMQVLLRGGWSGRIRSADIDGTAGISVGLGIGVSSFRMDYAWVPFGALGDSHRFSINFRF